MITLTKALNNYDELNSQINECRDQVIQSVAEYGLTSAETLLHSEKLNEVIWRMQVQQQTADIMQYEKKQKDMEALEKQIDQWRGKMIEAATLYGFTSPETLHCSEQLDTLILQMQILHASKKKTCFTR